MNSAIIFGVTIVVLLIFYIIARVKTNRGEMTMCTNGWDLAQIVEQHCYFVCNKKKLKVLSYDFFRLATEV